MKKREVDNILAQSSSEDWIKDDATGSFTYKKDLSLRIKRKDLQEIGTFQEEWATNFPDSNADSLEYLVKYNNSFVSRKVLVDVDGGRAILPMPNRQEGKLIVTEKDVNFAKIVSIVDSVDDYIQKADFKVVSDGDDGWGF